MDGGNGNASRFFGDSLLQHRDLLVNVALGGAAVFHGDVERLGRVLKSFQPAFPIIDPPLKRHHHILLVDGSLQASGIPLVV
ncbi:hypothetical protein D3C81_1093870 [compost metagenome]